MRIEITAPDNGRDYFHDIMTGLQQRFTTQEETEGRFDLLCVKVAIELGGRFEKTGNVGKFLFGD